MQRHNRSDIAQRLLQDKSFREVVRSAFGGSQPSAFGGSRSSDLLQRCRALNACIQQGHVPQPVQQEASALDSDICNECSTSDSDISDEKEADHPASAAACGTNAQNDSCARRQPTLVQHAAAATIQRRFRQQWRSKRQDCDRNMQPCPGQNNWSTCGPVKLIAEAPTQQQHEAASCIQAWWRRRSTNTRVQVAAPSTPPCSNMQASCTSKHSSRPDSASSSSQTDNPGIAELNISTCEEESITELAVQARPSSAALAALRVSRAALQRKAHAMPNCSPAPKPAAKLVAQRTSDRAQQVQDMEQHKWLVAQFKC